MIRREKDPGDYAQIEAYLGTSFFHDAGRTAIAQVVVEEDAYNLAEQNPMRSWIFKTAIREFRTGTSNEDPFIGKMHKRLHMINSLEAYIANYEAGLSGSKLQEHQHDVFHDLSRFMRGNPEKPSPTGLTRAGYIEMPTGTGKTVVFSELIKVFHGDTPKQVKSLVLVPQKRNPKANCRRAKQTRFCRVCTES